MNYFPLHSSISFHRMIIQKNNWKSQPVQERKNKAGRDDPPCCYLNPCRRSHDPALRTQVTNRAVPNGVGQPPSWSLAIGWRSCHRSNSFVLKRANPRILSPSPHFFLICSLFQVLWRIDFPIIIIVFPNFSGRDFSLFFLLFFSFFSYHFLPVSFLASRHCLILSRIIGWIKRGCYEALRGPIRLFFLPYLILPFLSKKRGESKK